MKSLLLWLGVLLSEFAFAGPSVLNNDIHGGDHITPGIIAVGGAGIVDVSIFVDRTAANSADIMTQYTNTVGTPFFSVAGGGANNHAIYTVLNKSIAPVSGFDIANDITNYSSLETNNTIYSTGYGMDGRPSAQQPPVAMTVLTSPNSGDGATGGGIEFGLSINYKGLDTSADSWDTAYMAGFLAVLKSNHPTWTWGDIKGALRQTATNWATGYNPANYGYGFINWDNANAITSTASLFLQPPLITANIARGVLTLTVYAFRQTRRHHEVVYAADPAYVWPIKNEYTSADILNSGAGLLFTTNGTDLVAVGNVTSLRPGRFNLIGFTTDNSGNFSRVESFSAVSIMQNCPPG